MERKIKAFTCSENARTKISHKCVFEKSRTRKRRFTNQRLACLERTSWGCRICSCLLFGLVKKCGPTWIQRRPTNQGFRILPEARHPLGPTEYLQFVRCALLTLSRLCAPLQKDTRFATVLTVCIRALFLVDRPQAIEDALPLFY